MLWRRADKARQAVKVARSSIDEWITRRPPPVYYPRSYSLPADDAAIPEAIKGPMLQFLRHHGLREFEVAFPSDAQSIDADVFKDEANAILLEPVMALFPLIGLKAAPDLMCELLISVAYGTLQTMAWYEQVSLRPRPGLSEYAKAADFAEQAKRLLGQSGKTDDEWLDAVIRIDTVIARAMLRAGQPDKAIGKLFYIVGWYKTADALGHRDLVRRRYDDWLQALYAIVDYGHAPHHQAWISTASTLIKDLKIGRRQANPFRVESVPRAWNGSVLDLHLQPAFVDAEWQRGLDRLGAQGALIDVVVTDDFVHTRLVRGGMSLYGGGNIRAFRTALPQVDRPAPPGEKVRGVRPITPTSCVLEPSVGGPLYHASLLQDHGAPTRPSSSVMRWGAYFQKVHVHYQGDRWTWQTRWSGQPMFEQEMWKTVYAAVFADAVEAASAAGIRHLILSPDGSLSAMPHHLLRCPDGSRLGDRFLVSYAPNATGLLSVLDAAEPPGHSRSVIVEDPSGTVGLAGWECEQVAKSIGIGVHGIRGGDATAERLKMLCVDASILHFSGHATFGWADPDAAFLRLAGAGRLTLADLRGLALAPGALVFLSACDTGRRAIAGARSSSRGIVSAFLEASAATVICTLWPVHSTAAALVAAWFYECWMILKMGRLESLKEATRRLMDADRTTCEQKIGRRIYMPGERPFSDEFYWGAFVLYGAW